MIICILIVLSLLPRTLDENQNIKMKDEDLFSCRQLLIS